MRGLQYLEERIERIPEGGCWIWTQHIVEGYGQFKDNGVQKSTHREMYKLFYGEIPEGKFVCHRCDVRCCINPHHLFLGTAKENMQDAVSKGRSLRGEKHNLAILTESKVSEIKKLLQEGLTQKSIAALFGVSREAVSKIATSSYWGWVI